MGLYFFVNVNYLFDCNKRSNLIQEPESVNPQFLAAIAEAMASHESLHAHRQQTATQALQNVKLLHQKARECVEMLRDVRMMCMSRVSEGRICFAYDFNFLRMLCTIIIQLTFLSQTEGESKELTNIEASLDADFLSAHSGLTQPAIDACTAETDRVEKLVEVCCFGLNFTPTSFLSVFINSATF